MHDYNDDYNAARMIEGPHTFEIINTASQESQTTYETALTGGGSSSSEANSGPNLSVLTSFPSYFSSREEKMSGHSKPPKINSINTIPHMMQATHSHNGTHQATHYHHMV